MCEALEIDMEELAAELSTGVLSPRSSKKKGESANGGAAGQAQNLVAALRIKLEEIEAGDKKAQREIGDSRLAKIMQIYHSYRDFLLGCDSAEWWATLYWKHENVVTALSIWRNIGSAARDEKQAQQAAKHWWNRGMSAAYNKWKSIGADEMIDISMEEAAQHDG